MSTNKPFKTKAEQAAEARAAAEEVAPDPAPDNPNPPAEVTPPPIEAAADTPPAEEETPPAPKQGTPHDDARSRIAQKFKAQRAETDNPNEYTGDHREPHNNNGNFGRQPEGRDPPPADGQQEQGDAEPPQEAAPSLPTIKVRGKTVQLTPEMLERAQKVAAADDYLAEAKETARRAKAGQPNRSTQPVRQHPDDDQTGHDDPPERGSDEEGAQHQRDPELVEAVRSIQLGDPEDAADVLAKLIDSRVQPAARKASEEAHLRVAIANDVDAGQRALANFREANPDIANDPRAEGAIRRGIFDAYRKDLADLGLEPDQIPTNEAQLVDYHRMLRIRGHNVRTMAKILDDEVREYRDWRGQPQPKPGEQTPTTPNNAPRQGAPRVEVSQQRADRKNSVTPQPRAAAPASAQRETTQPEDQQANRLAAVRKAQAARGQRVAH